MTKLEKRQIVFNSLKDFIENPITDDSEELIEKIILDIYSSGFDSISKLQLVNQGIDIFLKDIMTQKFEFGSNDWESTSSIVGLLGLIDISVLPDK
jgi:hypothetical protein